MQNIIDPWRVNAGDFPRKGSPADQWEFLLRYAVLAPSSHNTQPWLFHLNGIKLELRADRRRSCPVVDPEGRQLLMSCGCALFHLRCALHYFGNMGTVTLFPDAQSPDLVATLTLGQSSGVTSGESALLAGIPGRRTHRQPFKSIPIPATMIEALSDAALTEGAWLQVIGDDDTRFAVADLVAEGDRRQWASRDFRLELSRWVHADHSARRDGIPGYAQSVDDLLSSAGPMIIRTFDMGDGQAAKDHDVAMGSPALAILGTDGESAADWVAAGQALARILLRARTEGISASFLNQPVELPDLRLKLRDLGGRGGYPQVLLRLGFASDVRPTPRRHLEELLV